jgi:hypothetical protein
MAQSIILKRSALSGKVPTTSSLEIGEIAINTYDGKLFLKKAGATDSIQTIVTTDSLTTGSISLTQTGSFGEIIVSQDANIQRDLFVIRDIITNGDIDAGGDISGSGLQVNDTLNITHGIFNLSASATLTGSLGIDGDLTVLGTVNARQFNINVISSSILFQSGSTKFGDTSDDTHEFTGSVSISGSLTVTASANLSGSIVINGLTYPTANFADGQYGVEVPTLGVNNVFELDIPKTIYEYVKNNSGTTLLKGTPVHSVGASGFNTLVIAASASVAATMPATFILAQDLDSEEEGLGIVIGAIQGIDTTGLTAGDAVYVGANGGFTQTKPTGSNLIQNLGIVTKVGVNGGGVVLGAGRSNDVPNIQEGYFWVGNSGSVATATPTSSFELSGRGVISGSNQLPQIAGLQEYTASLKGAIEVSGQNVNVLGMITAQQFNVTYVSSSIIFQSGSTKFGDTSDDTHEFTGSVSISGSFLVNGTEVGVASGPNTFDFNLDPEAAGTVNFIQDSTGNTLAIARTGSFDIEIEETQYLSLSPTEMLITTGSITANYMHLAKYISDGGDLDFNI